ncbi:hypothetical protein GQ53DRAFT_401854 [Thozetella sp. PMI_491]|nr:hypothetical protein GQ53DRAFT_401854 [Thozetella sp. PMI_491]
MAPPIAQIERTWLYITWPAAFVVHILQIRYMPSHHKSLQFSIFLFAILSFAFFGGFTACDTTDSALASSNAAYGLFYTLEIICMTHIIFLQYVATIYPLAATIPSSRARLGFRVTGPVTVAKGTPLQSGRRNVIVVGILAQCIWVGIGTALLAVDGIKAVFGAPTISYLVELGLFVYYLVIERRTRTSTLWWWTGIATATATASITLLVVGLCYHGVPVFGIECIFALFDSLGGVFRQYQIGRNRDSTSKDAPARPFRRSRDTPSFGDFYTSRSDLCSCPQSPTKSDHRNSNPTPLPSLPPALPPPPPPVLKAPLPPDLYLTEKSMARISPPVPSITTSIPTNPSLFLDVPGII